jgi:hypothetical protein
MAMKMLAAGGLPILTDGVRTADESNPSGYLEFEPVKALPTGTDTRWLASARGKAVKIVSPLLTYLPESYDYRVLFMRRDLDEIVASQQAMLDARQEPRAAADDRLRTRYEEHLLQIDRFLARRSCFSSLTVHYADVLADPREQSARIAAFLGGRLDVSRMAAVVEPTLYRRRQRRGDVGAAGPTSAESS